MKKMMLGIIALAVLSGGALLAQDLTGTWQGTISSPKVQRVVIKISKADGGGFRAVEYKIDQGPQGVGATVTLHGSTVKIIIPAEGGAYEGKLDRGGKLIVGVWTGGLKPAPMNLTLATPGTAWEIPRPPPPRKPMAADADPVFEVATIKPSDPTKPGRVWRVNGRRFIAKNMTLSNLITFSYALHPRQLTGGPPWMQTDKYDLDAQPDGEGQPNLEEWKVMIQKLLADRCKLAFHHDQRKLPAYALVVAKTGPKLTRSAGDPNGIPRLFFTGFRVLPARNASMAEFVDALQRSVLDRPVVDRTGLSGKYDFTLAWTPDAYQLNGLDPGVFIDAAGPDLFTAIQQQLGLKLESLKAPVDVLVIDHAERPSEN